MGRKGRQGGQASKVLKNQEFFFSEEGQAYLDVTVPAYTMPVMYFNL